MNEYKRLTKRTDNGDVYFVPKETDIYKCLDRLAELEDMIESGKLVELPCEIGDTVWVINAWMEYGDRTKGEPYFVTRYELVEGKATGFEIYGSDCRIMQNTPRRHGVQPYVFTSKAQAEARLKKLKGE